MKNVKILLLPTFIFLTSFHLIAQENSQLQSTITIRNSETRPLLQYLFDHYGIEDSEAICLNIQNYELEHNVKVLFENQFNKQIQSVDLKIEDTDNPKQRALLEDKKKRFVNFSDIENIVNHN